MMNNAGTDYYIEIPRGEPVRAQIGRLTPPTIRLLKVTGTTAARGRHIYPHEITLDSEVGSTSSGES